MRFRLLAAIPVAALTLLTACSDDIQTVTSGSTGSSAETVGSTPAGGSASSDTTGDMTGDTSADTSADTSGAATDDNAPVPMPGVPPKPEVQIPDEIPTELVVTVLTPGTGPEAVEGDTVVVHYVGVRSEDGAEFDNSYDRGSPFDVTLGAGGVIAGWDQGLIGAQQGAQIQLDIPADLAYGDSPPSDPIQAGDALTFVIDVVAVLPVTDPADAPEITVEGGDNIDAVAVEELVEGTGDPITEGRTAAMHIVAFRADTGEQLISSWESGSLEMVQYIGDATIPGLFEGMEGVQVGARRQITIPFADAFGDMGQESIGLPAATDLVLVIDVFAIY